MKYNVFYNPDCGKYGVEIGRRKQVLMVKNENEPIKKAKLYTKYKGVAEKWCENMNNGNWKEFSY